MSSVGTPRADTSSTRSVQRRTLAVLAGSVALGGVGIGGAATAGGLLVAEVAGTDSAAGLAQTLVVLGGAMLAVPLARVSAGRGRRRGLSAGYSLALLGAVLVVAGAGASSVLLLLVGMALLGGAMAAGLQARFAATDLSSATRVGRDLSLVVWMTAVGAIVGPNLADPAAASARALGLPPLSGMFLWAGLGFALATGLLLVGLRPDPLLLARRRASAGEPSDRPRPGMAETFRAVFAVPAARLAFAALVLANATMIGLMVMTPLHLNDRGASLRIVGVVISVHVAGMYLLSPLVGALADAIGRERVIGIGALAIATCGVVVASAPTSTVTVAGALFMLGLGWSGCMVAGSALLTAAIPVALRPSAQGVTDLSMGLGGAAASALAGVVFGVWSYAVLGVAVAVIIAPLTLAAVTRPRPPQQKQVGWDGAVGDGP